MGVREAGVVGLGLLVVACGGGSTSAPPSGATGPRTTGTELVTITRIERAPRSAETVEVDESRLPTSVPRIDLTSASAEGAEEPTQEEASPDAMSPPAPAALEVAAREICPADIASLRVRARNIPNGAAIVLTARGDDDVARVRDRMRELALARSTERALRARSDPSYATMTVPSPGGVSWSHGFADPSSPLLSADDLRLVEIPNGVRMELRYGEGVERASVWDLRAHLREDVAALDDGVCPLSFQIG